MIQKPLVSIILPYFYKKTFVDKTLKSIKKQTYQNFELVFIYDNYDKKELPFVKNIIKDFKKYKIVVNNNNLGASKSRNIGIKNCKGKFIAFIDADDIWKPSKLKIQIKLMLKNNANFSYTSYKIIDENNKFIKTRNVSNKIYYEKLLNHCEIGLSTVILKKNFLGKKIFPPIQTQEDFALWLSLIKKKTTFLPIKKCLSYWRKSKDSLSSNSFQKFHDAFKVFHIYEKKNFIMSIISVIILSINKLKK